MPLTKSDIPDLLLPGLRADFAAAYQSELDHSISERLATVVNTTQPIQKYPWLGAVPPLREFIDERRPSGLAAHAVSIEDKVFESTIAVDRKAIEDDQLDLIRLRIRDLAYRIAQHRHQMVVEALSGGFAASAYDGATFFSTSHPLPDGTTFSNRTTDALDETSLATAMSQMMLVPDDTGTPLGVVPDTIVVGPKLQWAALELAESPTVVNKSGDFVPPYANVFAGRLRVVVSPFLRGAADDYWFLLDTKRPIRGLILQQRSDVPVEFNAMEAHNSESGFMRDRYLYGVRARYNVGYGLWQAAYGAIL